MTRLRLTPTGPVPLGHRAPDRRDRTAQPDNAWRRTWAWKKRARAQVHAEPWCALCGRDTDLTADHIHPVAAGGDPRGPLRTLCRPCNSRLGATIRRGGSA